MSTTAAIDLAMLDFGIDLGNLVGVTLGEVDECEEMGPERVAVHEAGHALVMLVDGQAFGVAGVREVRPDSYDGAVTPTTDRLPPTPSKVRLRTDLGGAVAEIVTFGDVGYVGVECDLRKALARSYALPGQFDAWTRRGCPPDAGIEEAVGWVREAAREATTILRRRRRALERLATAIAERRTLTYAECARVVRTVRVRPRYGRYIHRSEGQDLDTVHRYIEARDRRLIAGGR